ncbi:40S ribosomal S10-like protein, putative [Medicago truncatula]|uniref:40S ribosomal S10-like protein, putative n=1 Tax=Medicago truncatula TaxID=3880 RepID=G7KIA7_MEDTR|nr:40S ribosomal S10-like protein, putative [Medicago truncatula]
MRKSALLGMFETMTDLFIVSIRFNRGNPQMFKFRYINVTLKGLKDQLDEINQEINPGW